MMNFKEFRRLYTGDPVTLHITMELLLQNGRKLLLESTEDEIVSSLNSALHNFFTDEKLREAAEIAKSLAALETSVLLAYMKRAVLAVEKDQVPECVILREIVKEEQSLSCGSEFLEKSVK